MHDDRILPGGDLYWKRKYRCMPRPPISRTRPYTPRLGSFAGQTFHTERGYRNALAARRGFQSWEAQRRSTRIVDRVGQLRWLHPSERLARRHAFEALSSMRTRGLSLEQASREAHTTPSAVIRHAGPAVRHLDSGRYRPTAGDRLYRPLRVLTTDGEVDIDTRGSRVASLVAAHQNAVKHFLATGNTTVLEPFVGKKVQGHELETRPEVIEERGHRGELEFEDLYRD